MAESVSRGDHNLEFLEIVKLEFRQLREQLVDHVCREVREFMNSKHDGHGPLHVRHEQHLQVLPLPTDGTASAESCKRFNRSDCSETSSEQAPEIPEEGSDWLYRPGKAFAPSRMLKKIGEDDMIKRTSSFGGLITLKRRFSGQAFEQPLWDEGSKRFVKDLSHHSHHPLRNAGTAFPSVPDVPNVPAPALEVEPAMGALEEESEEAPAKTETEHTETETIQAFQSKTAIASPSRTSGPSGLDKVFSFQRHSSVEFGFRESVLQRLAWRVVSNMVFESTSMFMLIANSIAIGIQTDYVASNMVSTVPAYLRALDIVFCIFFALELSVRLPAFGRRFFTMTGCGWNVLDLILVSSQVAEEILFAVAMHTGGGTVQYNTEMMRIVRILRAIKVVRLVGAVRFAQDLQLLINCLFLSLKQFLWSALLLLLAIYVVAIYITQAATAYRLENSESQHDSASQQEKMTKWWGSMPQSVLSLFQGVTGGVDWHEIADPLIIGISPWFGLLFIVFMAFCILALLNVITGTFVETMSQQAKDLKLRNRVLQARRLFCEIDLDGSGFISPEEIVDHTSNPAVQEFFESIDVHPSEAHRLLEVIDIDGNGKINFEEFLEASMRLNGAARSSDLILLAREMKRFHASQLKYLSDLKSTLLTLRPALM